MNQNIQNNVLIIPKEKATFWMDGRGRWHNQHGPFENKKIIDYFNAAIQWDANGYYVTQEREQITEKVYFSFEDTPLFVVDVIQGPDTVLLLNTRRRMPLNFEKLLICRDQLYVLDADRRIKFNARAMLKIADRLVYEKGRFFFNDAGHHHLIPSDPFGMPAKDNLTE